jgi:hypothetical protein
MEILIDPPGVGPVAPNKPGGDERWRKVLLTP